MHVLYIYTHMHIKNYKWLRGHTKKDGIHKPDGIPSTNECLYYTGFLYGGGHIISIDGNSFTFNGIGEYWLLRSPTYSLYIQVRFVQFENTRLTVASAIAVRHQGIDVQIEVRNGALNLFVGGRLQHLPTDHIVYIVTRAGVQTLSGLTVANLDLSNMSYSNSKLFIRANGSNALFITLPSGASLRVSLQVSFLQIAIGLSTQFRSYYSYYYLYNYRYLHTRGLMGTFNGYSYDDFLLPNNSTITSSSEVNTHRFGLACKCILT